MQAGQLQAYFATATQTPKVFCVTGGLLACLSAMGTFLSTNPKDSIESKDSKDVRYCKMIYGRTIRIYSGACIGVSMALRFSTLFGPSVAAANDVR